MAVFKTNGDWVFEYFNADTDPKEFGKFGNLVALWNERRGDRPAPSWSEFDFYDFKGWHGNLLVSEYFYEPFDYRYRLFGTNIADRVGVDVTGKRASELVGTYYDVNADLDFFEMVARGLHIARVSKKMYWAGREDAEVTFVELPMTDDGEKTNHCLTALLW